MLSAEHYWYTEVVDQMVIDSGLFSCLFVFLFNSAYLCYDLMICVLLNFTKCIHASLGRSRCKS